MVCHLFPLLNAWKNRCVTGQWKTMNVLNQNVSIQFVTWGQMDNSNRKQNRSIQSCLDLEGGMYWTYRLCRINANKEPGRVCPGRIFAENLLWAAAAVMFSSLRFDKAKDSDGNDIDIEPVFPSALVRWVLCHLGRYRYQYCFSYPDPFRCSITSRFVE